MMRALLFGLPGPQLFNHSEGPELGAMLTPLVRTVKKKKEKKPHCCVPKAAAKLHLGE